MRWIKNEYLPDPDRAVYRGGTMIELKPCPFCNGKSKLSFKYYRFWGKNYVGDKKLQYRVQVICNKCRSRGKPIITAPLINPNPWIAVFEGEESNINYSNVKRQTEMFLPYAEQAAEAWNTRYSKDDLK